MKHYRKASSKFRNHTGGNFKQKDSHKEQKWRHPLWRMFFNEYYIMENEEFRRVLVHSRLYFQSHFYQPLSSIHAKEAKNAVVNQKSVTIFFLNKSPFAVFSDQILFICTKVLFGKFKIRKLLLWNQKLGTAHELRSLSSPWKARV